MLGPSGTTTAPLERLSIALSDQKALFALSGNLCAFPGCQRRLIEPGTSEDDPAIIGQIAHIVGASRQGPRGRGEFSEKERAAASNLILLCRDHHAIIDAQPRTYSVAVLRQMKSDHEAKIAALLQPNTKSAVVLTTETLYSSLLPLTHIPSTIFCATSSFNDSQYEAAKQAIRFPRDKDILTPFLLRDGRLFTFFDIRRHKNPFSALINGPVEQIKAETWWTDPEGARRFQTLLNRVMHKWMGRQGVRYDPEHYRYYFEPREMAKAREETYRLQSGNQSSRGVVWQPITRATQEPKKYWIHLAASLSFMHVAPKQWCVAIRPERRITKDGQEVLESKRIGRRVTKLKAKMYNDKYLGELYFWLSILTQQQPRLVIKLGGQSIIVDAKLLTFDVQWLGIDKDAPSRVVRPAEDDLFSLASFEEAVSGDNADDEFGEADDFDDEDELE
jgi:hypothetical protein